MFSTDYLEDVLEKLKFQTHRKSTDKNYYGIWKTFNEFFVNLDRKPHKWEDRITLYITHLIENETQSKTNHSYASAIKSILKAKGVHINPDGINLSMLVSACKIKNDTYTVRLPVQNGLKNMLLDRIENFYLDRGQVYLSRLYRAIISTGYYSMLRIGELTSGSHPILADNVHAGKNKHKFQIVLRSSKNPYRSQFSTKSHDCL